MNRLEEKKRIGESYYALSEYCGGGKSWSPNADVPVPCAPAAALSSRIRSKSLLRLSTSLLNSSFTIACFASSACEADEPPCESDEFPLPLPRVPDPEPEPDPEPTCDTDGPMSSDSPGRCVRKYVLSRTFVAPAYPAAVPAAAIPAGTPYSYSRWLKPGDSWGTDCPGEPYPPPGPLLYTKGSCVKVVAFQPAGLDAAELEISRMGSARASYMACSCWRLRLRRNQKRPPPMIARPARPPTTPPAMAPLLELLPDDRPGIVLPREGMLMSFTVVLNWKLAYEFRDGDELKLTSKPRMRRCLRQTGC